MPPAAWVTLVITFLIIAAAALGLIRVIGHLKAVHTTLNGVVAGVQAVATQTSTVPQVVPSVNAHLAPVRDFCAAIPRD